MQAAVTPPIAWISKGRLSILAFLLILAFIVIITEAWDSEQYTPYEANTFPAMHIYSQYDPFEMERETWHSGTLTVTGAQKGQNFADISIGIRGRGNTTWTAGGDKKPLRIRLTEERRLTTGYCWRTISTCRCCATTPRFICRPC
jgi:hypothetical protein